MKNKKNICIILGCVLVVIVSVVVFVNRANLYKKNNSNEILQQTTKENSSNTKKNELFSGCKNTDNSISMYILNNDKVLCADNFDNDECDKIINSLSSVAIKEVKDWSAENVKMPVYGIETLDADGNMLSIAWTNGYLIINDKDVYEYDYDFEKLLNENSWSKQEETQKNRMPCSYFLSKGEDNWNKEILEKSYEFEIDDMLSLNIIERTKNNLKVEILNNSTEKQEVDLDICIQVCIDNEWYDVPQIMSNMIGYNSDPVILEPNGNCEMDYNTNYYGELLKGVYRVRIDDCVAKFIVE